MPNLTLVFTNTTLFEAAVIRNRDADQMMEALAHIVAEETEHEKDGQTVKFDPDRQVDIVVVVAAKAASEWLGTPKVCVRSTSLLLGTLESFDFGDMPARKDRIGKRVKDLLGIPATENIQMTLDLIPQGHWSRI